eukprot:GHVU01006937.1.p2 GENE.GHVU01006937.1~~GHVU01006937.1.p2  ORF type:complete len:137 (+),score=3.51 GHVU01006937.1:566-976(+)
MRFADCHSLLSNAAHITIDVRQHDGCFPLHSDTGVWADALHRCGPAGYAGDGSERECIASPSRGMERSVGGTPRSRGALLADQTPNSSAGLDLQEPSSSRTNFDVVCEMRGVMLTASFDVFVRKNPGGIYKSPICA